MINNLDSFNFQIISMYILVELQQRTTDNRKCNYVYETADVYE